MLVPRVGEESFRAPNLGDTNDVLGAIICSSGTTGLPKAVATSQKRMIYMMIPFWNLDSSMEDIIFNFSTCYWITGLFFMLFGSLYSACRVITKHSSDAKILLDIIQKYKLTTVLTGPFLLTDLLRLKDLKPLESVRNYIAAGTILSEKLVGNFMDFLPNGKLLNAYGSTENSCVITIAENNCENIGQLAQNMEMKIINEEGNNLGPNEMGEICTRTPVSNMGYFRNPEQTKETFRDNWIHSGDMGYIDDNGFVYLVARKKEILKYQCYQVSPAEVEGVINELELVIDSCVVGVLADDGNDIICAVVRRKNDSLTEEQIIKFVNDRVSDAKKIRGGVLFVSEFPLTASGKVIRRKVKEIVEISFKAK